MAKKEKEWIDKQLKLLKKAVTADDHNRVAAIEDLKFINGDQWPDGEKKRRSDKGRPALTFNLLPKYVDQVVGDMLHNTPRVKIRPDDSRADINIAKIRQGIIDNALYMSNFKGVTGYAAKQMVSCGYGAWRVLTRYAEENPFIQEMYVEGIRNPFTVYLDPNAKDQNYADANWGVLLQKMPKDDFEEAYPKATVPSEQPKHGLGVSDEMWYDKDAVWVIELFKKHQETVEMLQLEDGRVCDEEELKEIKSQWKKKNATAQLQAMIPPQQPPPGAMPPGAGAMPPPPQQQLPPQMSMPAQQPPQMPPMPPMGSMPKIEPEPKVAKRRETKKTVIKHWVLTCEEILSGGLDGTDFPGKNIPLILVKGKELNIEGKNYVFGLVRPAKDPQKSYNYWNTSALEVIAMSPKAPWVGTAKQFEGYEKDYATANNDNYPFLKYNPDPEAPGPPQRQQPGQPPIAIFEQIRRGEELIKNTIGLFGADVGDAGPERTGAAIIARQKPGDIGSFEFMENMSRAILYTGQVMNEMIPEIYDTQRDVRVRNIDDSETFVPINTTVQDALKSVTQTPEFFDGIDIDKLRSIFSKDGKDAKYNDITAGKYNVVVTTGPSYATQRQESSQHLMQLVQAMPQQMGVAADLLVQSMDFPDADELAARLRQPLVRQGIAKPRKGELPPPPMPPPPQVQLMQAKTQIEQSKIQMQQLKIQQETVKLEHEKIKMQLEMAKAQGKEQPGQESMIEAMKLQHEQAMMQNQEKQQALQIQLEQMRLDYEVQRQHLAMQHTRESHSAKLIQMEAEIERKERESKKESRDKKDPLRIRR